MAAADELVHLLGYSMRCEPLLSTMKRLEMNMRPKGTVDVNGNVYEAISSVPERNLSFTLHGYTRYRGWHGEPLSRADGDAEDELILAGIDFEPDNTKTKKQGAIGLPYGLLLGDGADAIIAKVGRRPYEKSSDVSYGHAWWFRFDEHRMLTALNPARALIWVRVLRLTLDERQQLRRKAQLRDQSRNLEPQNAARVEAFASTLPTTSWCARRAAGDSAFSDEAIEAVDTLLGAFAAAVAAAVRKKSAAGVYGAAKKVVVALNRFARKHDRVIETVEREELATFINDTVRLAGFVLEDGADLTEEWRTW